MLGTEEIKFKKGRKNTKKMLLTEMNYLTKGKISTGMIRSTEIT